MKLINRTSYMDTLTSLIGVPDIKVITGIRRSGKSKLLEALRDYVEAHLSNSNVIHINYNLDEFENLLEYHALLAYVKSIECPANKTFCLSMKFRCATVLSVRSIAFTHPSSTTYSLPDRMPFCCRAICRRSLRGARSRSRFSHSRLRSIASIVTRARSITTSMSTREPAVCPALTLIHCRSSATNIFPMSSKRSS